jgi:repressor LexA
MAGTKGGTGGQGTGGRRAGSRGVDFDRERSAGRRADSAAKVSRLAPRAGRPPLGPEDREPSPDGLTSRQRTILTFIKDAVDSRGYPPSMREIGEAVGLFSPSSVAYQLHALEQKGWIRRDPRLPRAIEVRLPDGAQAGPLAHPVDPGPDHDETESGDRFPTAAYVPVLGRIAAGGPILAEQAVEEIFPLPRSLVGDGEIFLLKVVGESMIDAAICDGDYVAVRSQQSAENGDIVAALLDDEATVKTFQRKGNKVWLLPHNPAYSPIDGRHAQILGKVVSVLRRV